MVILETKEQLVKQIEEAWQIITQADEALDNAKQALTAAHTNLRNFTRRLNDTSAVCGSTRVGASCGLVAGSPAEASNVRRMPALRKEYVLRSRRDPSGVRSNDSDAESGC